MANGAKKGKDWPWTTSPHTAQLLTKRRAASAAEIEIQNSLLLSPLMVDLVKPYVR